MRRHIRFGEGAQNTLILPTFVLATIIIVTGCTGYTRYTPTGAVSAWIDAEAELKREHAALVRQYRECLEKHETDPAVDCSGYRPAIQLIDKWPGP
jgi:hypothetical protein